MCYDVSFKTEIRSLMEYFPDLVFDDQLRIDFERCQHIQGHDFKEHPVIYRHKEDKQKHLQLKEWGVFPYAKDEETFKKLRNNQLNARSERIFGDSGSTWAKIKGNRCLIPLTGIYEHRKVAGFTNKIPYWVRPKDQPMFFLPALYMTRLVPDFKTGEAILRTGFAIITRAANPLMKLIHNDGPNAGRMPLFLPREMAEEFTSDLTDERYKELLDFEIPAAELMYRPVYTVRGPKGKEARPDNKDRDEVYEWGSKLSPIELAA